ncbi:Gfo/Idh/MocA family protein [Hoeflea prorocentri]|uniref:Gfo/Idh/MocA family oxidoreductase n=1 Tax=Hoeflea prorocentri TaxID=1922333 RepID=A0A9X3UFE3_9HYPH|nr:Gfo/Idh/MocA family oxidoreductase [Hoeflea prorocentri]MCY6379747.1 Gfo/Idh/MocA family oxidoreductase [Hoeflea prorocentri]MDA5397547.1 Gfo/Idh/MocA family oxidoreductase [Hoeflea prorocentri]
MTRKVRVALLGAGGWMGKCHTLGYRNVPQLFPEKDVAPDIIWVVDASPDVLSALRPHYDGARFSPTWQEALDDPAVDLVDICLPDNLHYEVAKAALLAGKHVYCEKPFTETVDQARELAQLAEERNLACRVGHNFPINPVHEITRELIENGAIGDLVLFKASMHVDALAAPEAPFMWRCDGELSPTGTVGDIASHIFSYVNYLLGKVDSLVAEVATTTAERPVVEGSGYVSAPVMDADAPRRKVTNSDMVTLLCKFPNGGKGLIDVSRVAHGRRFHQTYEIYGNRGAIAFDYDNVNRLRVALMSEAPDGAAQWRDIDCGPDRANYGAFLPVPNFGLGFNEFKTIEIAQVLESAATGRSSWPNFRDGLEITKMVSACLESAQSGSWVDLPED